MRSHVHAADQGQHVPDVVEHHKFVGDQEVGITETGAVRFHVTAALEVPDRVERQVANSAADEARQVRGRRGIGRAKVVLQGCDRVAWQLLFDAVDHQCGGVIGDMDFLANVAAENRVPRPAFAAFDTFEQEVAGLVLFQPGGHRDGRVEVSHQLTAERDNRMLGGEGGELFCCEWHERENGVKTVTWQPAYNNAVRRPA
jgi:hypothetical protein